jgi:RNA polymerase sigma factor (sigma-70 family)
MRELLQEWAPRVYRFARRLTPDADEAEDLTQETLLRAWGRRSDLRNREAVGVWLFRIAANLWTDRLRRARRPAREALPEGLPAPGPAPDRLATDREDLGRALRALDALPPRQRQALYLCACEGLSPGAIADVLGITPEAARASLSLARKKLREALPDLAGQPETRIHP